MFKVGDAVKVLHNGQIGIVEHLPTEAFARGTVIVKFPGMSEGLMMPIKSLTKI